jgi:Kef-type K+ transport system membrane component KefB
VTALFLGVALGVSAIPVIARILLDLGLLTGALGQRVVTAAVLDDLAGWLLLSVVSAMAGAGLRVGHLATTVAGMLGVLVLLVVLTPRVVRPVWARLEAAGRPGNAVTAVVVTALVFGAGSAALGMEPVLGGLVAGLVVGSVARNSPWYESWSGSLATFVLAVPAPIFFATAGLRIDLRPLAHPGGLAVAAAVVLVAIAGKFGGVYLGARIGRLSHWEGVALGAGLNARGVIQIVVASVGLRLGILGEQLYTAIILTAVVTSVLAGPWMSRAVRRMTPAELNGSAIAAAPAVKAVPADPGVQPSRSVQPATPSESRPEDDERDDERVGF